MEKTTNEYLEGVFEKLYEFHSRDIPALIDLADSKKIAGSLLTITLNGINALSLLLYGTKERNSKESFTRLLREKMDVKKYLAEVLYRAYYLPLNIRCMTGGKRFYFRTDFGIAKNIPDYILFCKNSDETTICLNVKALANAYLKLLNEINNNIDEVQYFFPKHPEIEGKFEQLGREKESNEISKKIKETALPLFSYNEEKEECEKIAREWLKKINIQDEDEYENECEKY